MPLPSDSISNISKTNQEGWEVYLRGLEMIREGQDILTLAIGDHDFPTPEPIREACKNALDNGHTNYTTMQGLPGLKTAMAKVSTQAIGMPVGEDEVVAVPGGQAALYAAMRVALNPGDHVVVVSPHYVTYPGTVRSAGAGFTLVEAQADDGFQPRADAIEAAIQPNTKAVLINTPNNPTCAIYDRATLEGIAEACIKHDLWLISDEVYWSLSNGKHISPRTLPGMKERTLVVMSMSKSHAMTGWRVGWLILDEPILHYVIQHNLVNTYGISDFISRAATQALENGYGVKEIADTFKKRGKVFLDALSGINTVRTLNEPGGMYLMLDIRGITMDSPKFAMEFLETEKVSTMPGDSFGPSAAGHLRISLCQPEEKLKEAARRLQHFISSYPS